jgi:PAS domain S-box-containing protein
VPQQVLSEARGSAGSSGGLTEELVVVVIDPRGRIRSAGPSVERVLALSPSALVDTTVDALVDPHDRQRLTEAMARLHQDAGAELRLALRLLDRAGRPIWVDAGLQQMGSDVVLSARPYLPRGAEEPTVATGPADNDRYHALVQNSADILMVVDPDGTVRFANPSMLRTLGLAPEELVGPRCSRSCTRMTTGWSPRR